MLGIPLEGKSVPTLLMILGRVLAHLALHVITILFIKIWCKSSVVATLLLSALERLHLSLEGFNRNTCNQAYSRYF